MSNDEYFTEKKKERRINEKKNHILKKKKERNLEYDLSIYFIILRGGEGGNKNE